MKITSLFLLFLLFPVPLFTQEKPAGGKISGYVFGDYYFKLGGDSSGASSQYSALKKDNQAFQFRRMYLYYDHTFDEKYSAQFLLEGNDKALEPGGKHGIFVKTAYLEIKNVYTNANLWFGLIPAPTWTLSERTWNYRSVEKTIMDFRGLGGGTDMGVGLRGKFDSEGMFNYAGMIGNGNGQKPENNRYKKYYLSLNAKLTKEFVIEGYFDFEPAANDANKTSLKGFVAYQTNKITIGVEAMQQRQRKANAGNDKTPIGLSLFSRVPFPSQEKINVFVRFDIYNPDSKMKNAGYSENFFVVGLDYMPIPDIHLMPNFWVNTFSDKSAAKIKKDADLVARITFYYVYK
ncbi:MAG: hypothetical protein KGZ58_03585 [Ignavibacteriales bacterium]|nr:hypothetical protein [Ignavibacteriales bacterium]